MLHVMTTHYQTTLFILDFISLYDAHFRLIFNGLLIVPNAGSATNRNHARRRMTRSGYAIKPIKRLMDEFIDTATQFGEIDDGAIFVICTQSG